MVGSGIAGCRAAIEASNHVDSVTLVTKGAVARSGASPMTQPGFSTIFEDGDTQDTFFLDIMKGGSGINDPQIVKTFVSNVRENAQFFENLGIQFIKSTAAGAGHKYARSYGVVDDLGRVMQSVLRKELWRRKISVIEDFLVTCLLNRNNVAFGVVGINLPTGELHVFISKATVFATGGFAGVYSVRTTNPRSIGDGIALALRAGVEIADMEFIQSNPWSFAYPESVKGVVVPGAFVLMPMGARYLNGKMESFLEKYDPIKKDHTTRDILARGMYTEILEGRGTEHGGVYLDFSNVKEESIRKVLTERNPGLLTYMENNGLDLEGFIKKPVEVCPAAHFTPGGIRTNEKCETNLRGFFAAGEVTAGLHGANRLSGNGMAEAGVFGKIAGKNAALYAFSTEFQGIDQDVSRWIKEEERRTLALLTNRTDGKRPSEIREEIERLMFEMVGFGRTEGQLKQALERIESIERNDLQSLSISDKSRIYNVEWAEALELYNIVLVARLVITSALHRTESRGCHFRRDHPNQDDNKWAVNVILRQQNGEILVEDIPITAKE